MRPRNVKFQNHNENADRHLIACALRWRPFYTPGDLTVTRGVRPFLSDKYDITKHLNFKYTADADEKNAFDIEAFLSTRLKLKPNEVCDVYEVDTSEDE